MVSEYPPVSAPSHTDHCLHYSRGSQVSWAGQVSERCFTCASLSEYPHNAHLPHTEWELPTYKHKPLIVKKRGTVKKTCRCSDGSCFQHLLFWHKSNEGLVDIVNRMAIAIAHYRKKGLAITNYLYSHLGNEEKAKYWSTNFYRRFSYPKSLFVLAHKSPVSQEFVCIGAAALY